MLFCINLPNFIYIGPDLRRSNDVVSIFNMVAAAAQYYFRFCICWRRCLQNVKIYPPPKFGRHGSIHGWDIVTSVSEKKRLPYWNSTSGFHFDHIAVIRIHLPNFIHIGAPNAEIWRHIDFCRAMRCISAAYVGMRCPSVCLSRSWIMSKRIHISPKFFHHRLARPF